MLSSWMTRPPSGLGVCVAAAGWGVAIATFGLATTVPSRSCSRRRRCRGLRQRGAALDDPAPGHARRHARTLSGIELAQVAGTPALGNLEAGIVRLARRRALLDRLRRARACIVGTVALALALPTFEALRQAGVIDRDFFARSVHEVAPELIGTTFLCDGVGGLIVEAEAYDNEDRGPRLPRGAERAQAPSMFGPPGHAYVYRSYGIHWCVLRLRRGGLGVGGR